MAAQLHRHLGGLEKLWTTGVDELDPELVETIGQVVRHYRSEETETPEPLEVDQEVVALAMLRRHGSLWLERKHWPAMIDRWVSQKGAEFALEVLSGAGGCVLVGRGLGDDHRWSCHRKEQPLGEELPAFEALRRRLVELDQASWEACLNRAASLRQTGSLSLRCKLALALDQPEWAAEDAGDALGALGDAEPVPPPVIALLSVLERSDLVVEIARQTVDRLIYIHNVPFHDNTRGPFEPYHSYRLRGLSHRVFDVVDRLGEDAQQPLSVLFEAATRDKEVGVKGLERILEALTMFRTEEVAQVLSRQLTHKKIQAKVSAFFRENPTLAVSVLTPLAAKRTKIGKVAKPLVGEARSVLEAGQSEVEPVGDRSKLPLVLERPPWRYKRRAGDEDDTLWEGIPKSAPTLPKWWLPAAHPPPTLRDGTPLDERTLQFLLEMMMFSSLETPYAGVQQVRAACEPASLSQFALSVYRSWQATAPTAKQLWPLHGLALLGDDEVVDPLVEAIEQWSWGAQPPLLLPALDTLAAVDSTYGRCHLAALALSSFSQRTAAEARARLERLAQRRGETRLGLLVRALPRLGFDERGRQELDFGPKRQLTAELDADLALRLVDGKGRPRATLPAARKTDDPDLILQTREKWRRREQRTRFLTHYLRWLLEWTMRQRRAWAEEDLAELIAHPIATKVAQRLLWITLDAQGTPQKEQSFRVTEDGSLGTVEDEPFEHGQWREVTVVHPLDLEEEVLERWTELFRDYELVQPFPQLARPVFRRGPRENADAPLSRLLGREISAENVEELLRRGFTSPRPVTRTGQIFMLTKELPGLAGQAAGVDMQVRVTIAPPLERSKKKLTGAKYDSFRFFRPDTNVSLSADLLDRLSYSELVYDLSLLLPSS